MPWIIAGNHTSIDSYEKRNQKGFLRDNLIVCKPEEVVESICDAMGKTLKGFATEEISTKVSEETIPTKSNLFTLGKR